jgi:hypothetical protein
MRSKRKRSRMSTIEVVTLPRGSAKLGVYSREHCPPHATCRDVAGQWVVRISFSFVDATIGLLSINPPRNSPGFRAINDLANAVQQNLPECRRLWWTYQQNNPLIQTEGPCCLNNAVFEGGVVLTATYDHATSSTLVLFSDGSRVTRVV